MSHVHTYAFHTTDPALAQRITALMSAGMLPSPGAIAGAAPVTAAQSIPAAPPAPPATPPAPPAPSAPPAPPVAVPAPPVPPPAPPAAPPVAVAPAASGPLQLDAQDTAVLGLGWTLDMMKAAATGYTGKLGAAGPAGMKKILADHGATRLANGTVVGANCLAPKHYPAVHALLSA